MSHGGAEQVIVERNGLVLELTLVQVVQARPPKCRLCHIVSYSKEKEFITMVQVQCTFVYWCKCLALDHMTVGFCDEFSYYVSHTTLACEGPRAIVIDLTNEDSSSDDEEL